jgi:hypothetical protein
MRKDTGFVVKAYLIVFAVFVFQVSLVSASEISMAGRTMPPTLEVGANKFSGAGSCNKEKCHGHATKPRANEYTTWIKAEIHAAGYSVLYEKEAKEIAKKFGIKGKAGEDQRCAVCHSIHLEKNPNLKGAKFDVNEGVTCEACHGPSSGYLEPHAKPYEPKGAEGKALDEARAKRHKESVGLGMWDAKNPKIRLETCVFCHYQISSKMLDAGHPDLNFEMTYFQKTMPVHWEETSDKGDGFSAKIGAAGQAIALREALKKLGASAGKEHIEASYDQAMSHFKVLKAIAGAGFGSVKGLEAGIKGLAGGNAGAVKLAGAADKLFNSLIGASYSKDSTPKIINAISSSAGLTKNPTKRDAEQIFMILDGLYSTYGSDDSVLGALDELYYGLYAEDPSQDPPPYDAKAFGQNLAKMKSVVK